MRKALPFVLIALVLGVLVLLMSLGKGQRQRRLDERITLRHRDKIPYGTEVAYALLPKLFPSARITADQKEPGLWDSLDVTGSGQVLVVMADYLDASREDLNELRSFAEKGNDVFVVARAATDDVETFFNLSLRQGGLGGGEELQFGTHGDSLGLQLERPAFADQRRFFYPGFRYDGVLFPKDTSSVTVLGRNESGQPDFVQLSLGRGHFFLHSAPLAFSNYFILHKQNAAYFEAALSVLPRNARAVVWNEYFLQRPGDKKGPNWLGALLAVPAFKWGLLTGLLTLALFLLLGMRRRQRMIPPYAKPTNESLDFVRTLGRLYYDRRDHRNLAEKMSTYFLEHVRSRYKLPTHTLDDAFVQGLQARSGYPAERIRAITGTIQYVQDVTSIPETELAAFHQQLEHFYQNT